MVSGSLVRYAPRLLILAGLLTSAALLSFGIGNGKEGDVRVFTTDLPKEVLPTKDVTNKLTNQADVKEVPASECTGFTFEGTVCLSKGTTLPKQCSFDFDSGNMKMDFCNRTDRCAQYAGGKYHPHPTQCPPKVQKRCHYSDLQTASLEKGVWDSSATLFSVPGCDLMTHTRSDILSLFKGKTLLFTGDSMMRQIYLRLIDVLRGQTHHIEHYYHTNSYYAASETEDMLVVGGHVTGEKAPIDMPDKVFEMYYFWDHHPTKFTSVYETINPDIHIASFMYWWKGKEPFSDIDKYLEAVVRYAKKRGPGYQYFYINTPWTKKGTFGGVDDDRRIPRNTYTEKLLLSLSKSSGVESTRLLDFAAYAAVKTFDKTPDGIHYMCIWRPGFPKQIKVKDSKFKPSGCRDPVGGNWVRVLLNSIDTS